MSLSLEAKEGGTCFSGLFLLTAHKILYGQEAVVLEMSVLTLIFKSLIQLSSNCFLSSFLKCEGLHFPDVPPCRHISICTGFPAEFLLKVG